MADAIKDPATPEPAKVQAQSDLRAAEIKALDAQVKMTEAQKSPEQRAVDKARDEADDARAKAAQAASPRPREPMTAIEARVLAPIPDDMSAGDHLAQKFGNDPANPHIYDGEQADPEKCTVRLVRITPDLPEPAVTMVHPDMVGNYLRAGWSR